MRKDKKRFLTLRSRYTTNLILIAVLAIVFTTVQLLTTEAIFTRIAKSNMVKYAKSIISLDINSESFDSDISQIESNSALYVELYNPRDTLVYTSNSNNWIYNGDTVERDELKPRIMKINDHWDIDKGSSFEIREEYFGSAQYLVYECTEGDTTLDLFYSIDTIHDNANTSKLVLLALSFLFIASSVLVIAIYSKQIITPVEKINNVTKKIAKMDFSERVPEMKIPDLNELGESVNHLSASLERNMNSLKEKNLQLESDMEKELKSEEVRKQFIANASHELKTPIAIIQSYAEGIKYDETHELTEEYCDIIIDEVDKMTSLIVRLMEMVKYDSQHFAAKFDSFNLNSWVEECTLSLQKLLSEKGISIGTDVDESFFGYGDKELLTQVLSNYLNNAISHCENENIVRVYSEEYKNTIRIHVFNTGKNIAEEDIPNIWDRFYRADKAHSRTEGRFGLGLSIVKMFQDIHNQAYGVENKEDGVDFWFDVGKYENR